MGKPTGFMEYKRESLKKDSISKRIRNFNEFEKPYDDDAAKIQAARCMDCGVPFCHGETGCPVDNLIPEFNDLIFKGRWEDALDRLQSTNNFPEFTGRLCPAPCESACTLGLIDNPVSIKSIERTIIDKGYTLGIVSPKPASVKSDKKVAVIGSGPAGLAAAQQLARAGHSVVVYEKADRAGGLLRYGIPDFKMEKFLIDRRVDQMQKEGVEFKLNTHVGYDVTALELLNGYNAIVLAMGSETPRDLKIPGRELKGVHFAMEYLTLNNRKVAGDSVEIISARDKNVVVIGGGDTGSDCVGTANRHGANSVIQVELFPEPPKERDSSTPWPLYPKMLRTSTSHEEGVDRRWSINTLGFKGNEKGELTHIYGNQIVFKNGKIEPIPNTEFEWEADLVFLAMGFTKPVQDGLISQFMDAGMELDNFGNVRAKFGTNDDAFQTSVPKVFACGDVRRGQSLIVWAISEGRKCASVVHKFLNK